MSEAYFSDTPEGRRQRYLALRAGLVRGRQRGFDKHWRKLGDYLMPRRTRFWAGEQFPGGQLNRKIVDSTARFAARTLSSGLHAGLTSPARPWMKLTTPDPQLAEHPPVRAWLHQVTSLMLTTFATSNLYNVLPTLYLDLGMFGTGAMSIVPDTKELFRCYSYPIGSYALGLDERGLVTSFVRDYQLSVRQIVEQFGLDKRTRTVDWTGISDHVKDLWDRSDYEVPIDVTWLVTPNDQYRVDRLEAKYLPWASCYFETGSGDPKFLKESGFATFPIMAPRWDLTGEDTYGTDCPGMTALGDVQQLQIEQKLKAKLLEKVVDPSLAGPSSLKNTAVSNAPNSITYVDAREPGQLLRPIHEVRLEGLQHLVADIREVQYRIQRAFYEDLFLMLARSDDRLGADRPTAREIDERHEEKLLALGPVLERTNDELLDPVVDRVYYLLEEAGQVPPPPEELRQIKLRIEYISILSQAQKTVGVVALDRALQSALALRDLLPEMRHKYDANAIVDGYADMLGLDPKMVRSNALAAQAQQAEAQAIQAQHQAEQQALMAKAARDNAAAPMTGDTALTRLVENAPPPQQGDLFNQQAA